MTSARDLLSLIKFSHTVFALPFALIGLLVASDGAPGWPTFLLVVAAAVCARTAAMAYNRFADRHLDAENPRTAGRDIPRGAVSPRSALLLTLAAGAGFLATCWLLGPPVFWLGWPVLAWLLAYSHAKRFTSLSHLWLGGALGLAPVAAWVAARGALGADAGPAVVLGVAVLFWVAGFDVLYACQDEVFDRQAGLHSLPARLGRAGAFRCAGLLHLLAVPLFAAFGVLVGLGPAYHGGVLAAAGILLWEHRLLRSFDLARIGTAFFTANGLISLNLLAATCIDLYLLS